MKKYKLKRLIILVPLIFILAFSSVPAGALSMEQYSDAISINDALSLNNELKLYTPFLFSAYSITRSANSSGADLRNIYRFDISHLMDPSDFRYSQGIDILFRGKDQADIYANYYTTWSLTNTSYVAPSTSSPGNQYLTITAAPDGDTAGGQSEVTFGMLMMQLQGVSLNTLYMSSSVNGLSSLTLTDTDVSRWRVKYSYSIVGTSTITKSINSYIEYFNMVDNTVSIPVLPMDVLEQYFGVENVYIDYCDVTLEPLTTSYGDAEYEGNFLFTLLGGSDYFRYSDTESLVDVFDNTDYNTGYTVGYDRGRDAGYYAAYDTAIAEVGDVKYNQGYTDGDAAGYQRGIDTAYSGLDFTSWLGVAATGFLDVPLFGNFTLGGILAVMLAIALVMIFIKFFAGG